MTGPDTGRITLVLTSPRMPAGLLSWAAWDRLRSADAVLAADPDPAWLNAFEPAGIAVRDVGGLPIGQRAGRLVQEAAAGRELLWWGSPDGDPGLTDALAEHLSRRAIAGRPPEIEVLTGSHDVPGARLLDLVAVMDTLRSPGGCPWDAEQTHASLLPYLLEEAHEVIEAVEAGNRDHLAEELGDLLLQVVFHARVAQEGPAGFGIDEVAAGIVAKLIRRHPHVFGAAGSGDAGSGDAGLDGAGVQRRWDELKAAEKPGRSGFDGIPITLPALARAQKMLDRLHRARPEAADREAAIEQALAPDGAEDDAPGLPVAALLLRAVQAAREAGVDAEAQLRAVLARLPSPEPAENRTAG